MVDQLGDILLNRLDIGTEIKTKSEENKPLVDKPEVRKKLTSKEKLKKLWKMRMQWEKSNDYPEKKSQKSVFEAVKISSPGIRKSNFSICEDLVKQFREKEAEKIRQLWKMRLEWEDENSFPERKDCELQGLEKSSTKGGAVHSRRSGQVEKQLMFNSVNVTSTRKQGVEDNALDESEKQKSISSLISKFLAPKELDKQVNSAHRTKYQSPKKNDVGNSIYSLMKKDLNAVISTNENILSSDLKKSMPRTKKIAGKTSNNVESVSPVKKKTPKSQKPLTIEGSNMNKSASVFKHEPNTLNEHVPAETDHLKRSLCKKTVFPRKAGVQEFNPHIESQTVNPPRKTNKTATNSLTNSQNREGLKPDGSLKGLLRQVAKQNSELNYVALTFPESVKYRSDQSARR